MEILHLLLIIAAFYICQADIWLTINDEKVSHYVEDGAQPKPIAILCHQRIALGNALSLITKKRQIEKRTTEPYVQQANPWSVTYEMSVTGHPKFYTDLSKAAFIGRRQSSQDYFTSGYILIAPDPGDSGLYRCRGELVSNGQQINEESETVTVMVAHGPPRATIMITNDAYASVIEVQLGLPLAIRCQTVIGDLRNAVIQHRVYKYQNLTRRNSNGAVNFYTTDEEVYYNSYDMWSLNPFGNFISSNTDITQYRKQYFDLTSTFTATSPGLSNTGLYYCQAEVRSPRESGGALFYINSSLVFIDVRGSAMATLLVAPLGYTANDKVCKFGSDNVLINRYTCDGFARDSLIAVCDYYSYDFIPIVQMTVGKRASKVYEQKDYESVDMAGNIGKKPYYTIKLAGSISTIFNASEICGIPEVTCTVSVPGGSPERTRIRTISLVSTFCQSNGNEFVKSSGL